MSWVKKIDWKNVLALMFGIGFGLIAGSLAWGHRVGELEQEAIQKQKEINQLNEENKKVSEKFENANNDSASLLIELGSCRDECLTINECDAVVRPLVLNFKNKELKEIRRIYKKVQTLSLWRYVERQTAFDLYLKSASHRVVVTITKVDGSSFGSVSNYFGLCEHHRYATKNKDKSVCRIAVKNLSEKGKEFLKQEAFGN